MKYIKYPKSNNLEEVFPLKEPIYLRHGKLSEEIDVLDELYSNLRKKGGNSLIKKGMTKPNKNILLISENKTNKNIRSNSFFHSDSLYFGNSQKDVNENNELPNSNLLTRIKNVFDFYCKKKSNVNTENSCLLASLSELCAEYEVNFRKMILCILINLPGEGIEYDLLCKVIFYKLLLLTTSETQSDIIDNMGGKEVKELGFEWYKHEYFKDYNFEEGIKRVEREADAFLESLGYKHNRTISGYQAINPNNKKIALFAHQGFGWAFLASILDIPYPYFATHFDLGHSSVTVIHFNDKGIKDSIVYPVVLQLSNDSHLYKEDILTGYQNKIDI